MIGSILSYLWQGLSATVIQILVLFGPGLLLTLALGFEIGFIQKRAVNGMGLGWYLGLFAWLGTILHELGHAVFCILFGHKITDMKLFHPDPQIGTLGYVKHSYNNKNVYQLAGNFFIGIGPILLGTAVIYLLAHWLFGLNAANLGGNVSSPSQLNSWNTFTEILQSTWNSSGNWLAQIFSWQHVSGWELYVFIYVILATGSSITLSPPDIKGALGGFIVIVTSTFIVNLATLWAGNLVSNFAIRIAGYYVFFYTTVFLIMLVNMAAALLILLPLSLVRSRHSRVS